MTLVKFLFGLTTLFWGVAGHAIEIQTLQSKDGIPIWLVEDHTLPFVALEVGFDGGTSSEPQEKRGVTNLMMGLLEEGAGDLDAQGFATTREELAASFGYSAYSDSLSVSARFLTDNAASSIDLLRQSLVAPRFDQDAIERVRAQVETSIRSREKDQNDIAAWSWNGTIFGKHPYGTSQDGTLETIGALTQADLKAAHKAALTKDRAMVSIVGDVTAQQAVSLVDRLLGDLPDASAWPLPNLADLTLDAGVQVVDYPTPQSVILFGHKGIDEKDDDFFAAFVLNVILGGGNFENRLMTELREKRGLTYGVGTSLASRKYSDLIVGRFATANDRVAQAIEVVRDVWRDIAENGVTADEVNRAKTYLTGAYPLRFDGNGRIAGILTGMQLQGRAPEYVDIRNDLVNAVTPQDVSRVARRLLSEGALKFVVVGQPDL